MVRSNDEARIIVNNITQYKNYIAHRPSHHNNNYLASSLHVLAFICIDGKV